MMGATDARFIRKRKVITERERKAIDDWLAENEPEQCPPVKGYFDIGEIPEAPPSPVVGIGRKPDPRDVTRGKYDGQIVELYNDGFSLVAIAARMGCSEETIKKAARRLRRAGSIESKRKTGDTRQAEVLALLHKGKTYQQIADKLEISKSYVAKCIFNLRKRGLWQGRAPSWRRVRRR